MQNSAWVKLLRHIPATEHCKLMLVTTSGTEIAIQTLLRIDAECLALRGRLAGSTDAGRVFFVPFTHIDYFGFQQPLKEAEFHELFGSLDALAAASPPPSLPQAEREEKTPAPCEPPPPVAPSQPTPAPRTPTTIKSTVLEKFRSRSLGGTQLRPSLDGSQLRPSLDGTPLRHSLDGTQLRPPLDE